VGLEHLAVPAVHAYRPVINGRQQQCCH
jgi:hypothetical protein